MPPSANQSTSASNCSPPQATSAKRAARQRAANSCRLRRQAEVVRRRRRGMVQDYARRGQAPADRRRGQQRQQRGVDRAEDVARDDHQGKAELGGQVADALRVAQGRHQPAGPLDQHDFRSRGPIIEAGPQESGIEAFAFRRAARWGARGPRSIADRPARSRPADRRPSTAPRRRRRPAAALPGGNRWRPACRRRPCVRPRPAIGRPLPPRASCPRPCRSP